MFPTREEVLDLIRLASASKALAVDTETTGLEVFDGRDYLTGLSFAFFEGNEVRSTYLPFRHPDTNWDEGVRDAVKLLIENHPCLVFHNAKFDIGSLRTMNIYVGDHQFFYDTMILAHLIDENKPFQGKGLDSLAKWYLKDGSGKQKSEGLEFWIKLYGWATVPSWLMYQYGRIDAELTLRLCSVLWQRVQSELNDPQEMWAHKQQMIRVLVDMKYNGIRVSKKRAEYLIEEGELAMAHTSNALGGINPASNTQMAKLMHEDLGVPILHWTKPAKGKDPSTHIPKPSFTKDAMADYEEILDKMYPGDTRVQNILTYRGWQKSVGFLRSWMDLRSPDGRLRPNFIMHKDPDEGGTVTGRLSCKDPNLQQIPRRSSKAWADRLKACFIPTPGYVLVEADYSQLELRLATAYAREASLRRVFIEKRDIFDEMSERLGITRDDCKMFVYATQYGAGVKRIAAALGITISQAKRLRNDYLATYGGFAEFGAKCESQVRSYGKAPLWSGRYRHFMDREGDARKAMNSIIQGGAADIVERVMVKCWEGFAKNNDDCRMLLQIHDAIIFEIKEEELEGYLAKIKETMEGVNETIKNFHVPFAVDAHKLGSKEKLW